METAMEIDSSIYRTTVQGCLRRRPFLLRLFIKKVCNPIRFRSSHEQKKEIYGYKHLTIKGK